MTIELLADGIPQQSSSRRYQISLFVSLALLGLAVLLVLIVAADSPLLYDEEPYLRPVALLHEHGLSLEFLRAYPQPAGLLHNILHWALEPLTELQPPLVRLVNPALLILVILVTFQTLRLAGSDQPMASSLSVMAIPFIWVFSGLALTEMPAIALLSSSVLLLVAASTIEPERPGASLAAALTGGLLLGLASLNRAMVLIVLGALPLLLLTDLRRALRTVAAFGLGAAIVVAPIIAVWGGMVPQGSKVPFSTSAFSIHNMTLSVCYAAVVMLVLAPRWFTLSSRPTLVILGGLFATGLLTGIVEISPMRCVNSWLPLSFAEVTPRLAGSAMLALAALFLISSVKNLYAGRSDAIWLFFCVAMLLLIVSPGKIVHQFSSRYIGMAGVMMVLAADRFAPLTHWRAVRLACGMLIGLTSLVSYLWGWR